jgi:spoIIIJ-associated protein
MDPLSARERRVIHLALKDENGVATRSAGDGPLRHVLIEPVGPTPRR